MRCPTLTELPPPPPGRTGWPWTEESPQLPDTMPDGNRWPRISIVTPSFNQGQFIEETIRSVLLQGYPDLEYIIIDGASTDNSVDIIKKYERWLTYWVSEKDNGQADAINKGWKRATGDILAWINSDDIYMKDALGSVALVSAAYSHRAFLYGDCYQTDENSEVLNIWEGRHCEYQEFLKCWINNHPTRGRYFLPQPSTFVTRSILNDVGMLDAGLYYPMDYDLWLRIAKRGYKFHHLPKVLATYRFHRASKGGTAKDWMTETITVSKRYWGGKTSRQFWHLSLSLVLFRLESRGRDLFNNAIAYSLAGRRGVSLNELLKLAVYYPPKVFSLSYLALFARNILGEKIYDRAKLSLQRIVSTAR
jgi:glycosyltransferase involved in cell wall biosynthesis